LFVKEFKKRKGLVIHLTMYGLSVMDCIENIKIERKNKNLLIIVGGSKVPPEYYQLADYNIAIGNQPHSEVSALGLMLYLLDNGSLTKNFTNGKIKIIPDKQFKKIIRN